MPKIQMLGGKCGCPFCKDGNSSPNWAAMKNKRGDPYGMGPGSKKKRSGR